MALDIGVVTIRYLERPVGPVREFLFELAGGDLDEGWSGGWDGNVFLEMIREDLERKARDYASGQGLSQDDAKELLGWVRGLPWERDDIMLHLNW